MHPILTECRVIKSELEIALIQYANDISSEAHVEVTNLKMPTYACFLSTYLNIYAKCPVSV